MEQPSEKSGIKEICVGNNSVWAMDSQGNVFYRAGICLKCPQGTKWVFMPCSMSNISLSNTDQVKFSRFLCQMAKLSYGSYLKYKIGLE